MRKRNFTPILTLILILVSFILSISSCTSSYRPVSDWEKKEFDKADRYAYPDDVSVRNDIEKFKSTIVAWPGIIKDSTIRKREEDIEISYLLEHHYYDWLLDGAMPRIWLSPRGEGLFQTSWTVAKDITQDRLNETTKVDDLLIVYGNPQIENGTLMIKASYIRGFDKKSYSTSILDYGRHTKEQE